VFEPTFLGGYQIY